MLTLYTYEEHDYGPLCLFKMKASAKISITFKYVINENIIHICLYYDNKSQLIYTVGLKLHVKLVDLNILR